MPSSYYWDACVILEYLNGDPNRLPHVNAMLDDAAQGNIVIWTSVLSITEVAFAAQDRAQGKLSTETEHEIDKLWEPTSPIRRVEFHRQIAEDARSLARRAMELGIGGLRSVDSMHLATASRLGVDEFHTYEDHAKQERWAQVSGLTICDPHSDRPQLGV